MCCGCNNQDSALATGGSAQWGVGTSPPPVQTVLQVDPAPATPWGPLALGAVLALVLLSSSRRG